MSRDHMSTLRAIQELTMRDLDEASDNDIRAEIVQDGGDPDALAFEVASSIDAVVAEFMRSRAAASKALMSSVARAAPAKRPAFDRLREMVQGAFAREPALATAFRAGTRQSEADWMSLYDDLVSLGKIEPESDAN